MYFKIENSTSSIVDIPDMGVTFQPNEVIDLDSIKLGKLKDSTDIFPLLEDGSILIIYGVDALDLYNAELLINSSGINFHRSIISTEMKNITAIYPGEIIFVNDLGISVVWVGDKWISTDGLVYNPDPSGTGPSGTYTESFEDINQVLSNWNTPANYPGISNTLNSSTTGKWNIRKNTTPSSGTGPSAAQDGSYFIYAEMSSGADAYTYKLRTSYFSKLTTLSFYFNMQGNNIGTFKFRVYRNGSWETQYTSNTSTGSSWNNVSLDLTNMNVEKIEFEYSGATGYQSDFCIDNVVINSI